MPPRKSLQTAAEGSGPPKTARTPLGAISNIPLRSSPRVQKSKQNLALSATLGRRRPSSAADGSAFIQRKNFDPDIGQQVHSEIKKYVWTPFRVGILVNFKFSDSYFKRYVRFIRARLGGSKFVVQMEKMDSLNGDEEENPCVRITVRAGDKGGRILYESWLVSVSSNLSDKLSDIEVNLPILLARGSKPVMEKVHRLLEVMFSTTVHRLFPRLKPSAFYCLAADETTRELNLEYSYEKDRLSLSLPGDLVYQMLHETQSDTVTSLDVSQVSVFFQKVQSKMKSTFGIDPVVLSLKSVRSQNFVIDADGKITMKSYKAFEIILTDLLDVAESRLNCALKAC